MGGGAAATGGDLGDMAGTGGAGTAAATAEGSTGAAIGGAPAAAAAGPAGDGAAGEVAAGTGTPTAGAAAAGAAPCAGTAGPEAAAGAVATGFARATPGAERSMGRVTVTAGVADAATAWLGATTFIVETAAAALLAGPAATLVGIAPLGGTAPDAFGTETPPPALAFDAMATGDAAFVDNGVAGGAGCPELSGSVVVGTPREVAGAALGLCPGGAFGALAGARTGCAIGCVRAPCRNVGGLGWAAVGDGFGCFGGSGRAGAGGGRPSFGDRFIGGPSSPSPFLFGDCGDASASPLPAPGKSFEKMLIAAARE